MSKTQQCKTCGAEIAKSAKLCPNCGGKVKKPFYIRVWFIALIVFFALVVIAGISDDGENKDKSNDENIGAEITPEVILTPALTIEDRLTKDIEQIVIDNYLSTDVDKITINENLGTDDESDYIALVYLTWNVMNSADTTKEVLALYSEDFAARIGEGYGDVSEFTVFWTVPYFSENKTAVKYSYERKDNGMYQIDSMIMIG